MHEETLIDYGKNSVGHSYSLDGCSWTEVTRKTLWDWITSKGVSRNEFLHYAPEKKEKIFLMWKWMTSNYDGARDCEYTRRATIHDVTRESIQKLPIGRKTYWTKILDWEDKCSKLRDEIGLGEQIRIIAEPPQQHRKVAEFFSGKVVKRNEWEE